MRKATHAKILPAQHQACGVAAAVPKRCKSRLVNRLLILGFLVTRSLVFAECPRSLGAPGVGWISQFSDDLTTQLDATIAWPTLFDVSFLSLIVLLGIVVIRGTAKEDIQPRRKEPQLSRRAVRNRPNQEGTL